MSLPVRVRAKGKKQKLPSSMSLYVGCHEKVGPRFSMGLPTSNDLFKKVPHRHDQLLEF